MSHSFDTGPSHCDLTLNPAGSGRTIILGIIFLMALGCGSGADKDGNKLQPHLSGSSKEKCDPEGSGCSKSGEVCVYNPWFKAEDGVDLNDYQAWVGSECGEAADDEAYCVQRPDPNEKSYSRSVCGCDGKTYDSYADAHAAGVSVSKQAACDESSNIEFCGLEDDQKSCPPTEFCKMAPDDSCGDYGANGTCIVPPSSCPSTTDSVCGCDGTTYSNECLAHKNEVSVASTGSCPTSSSSDS
ncbi:MAG: Kazal-type serine protease inhibitor domain-containing protein [Bradymonadaceae bacterium]